MGICHSRRGTGKCSLSEKIYELFVETAKIFLYMHEGVHINLVSVERGSTVHFHPQILVLCPSLHAVGKIAKNWRNRSFC